MHKENMKPSWELLVHNSDKKKSRKKQKMNSARIYGIEEIFTVNPLRHVYTSNTKPFE